VRMVDKFQSKIRVLNIFKSNSNSNFKTEVRKFELRLTSLVSSRSGAEPMLVCLATVYRPRGLKLEVI